MSDGYHMSSTVDRSICYQQLTTVGDGYMFFNEVQTDSIINNCCQQQIANDKGYTCFQQQIANNSRQLNISESDFCSEIWWHRIVYVLLITPSLDVVSSPQSYKTVYHLCLSSEPLSWADVSSKTCLQIKDTCVEAPSSSANWYIKFQKRIPEAFSGSVPSNYFRNFSTLLICC